MDDQKQKLDEYLKEARQMQEVVKESEEKMKTAFEEMISTKLQSPQYEEVREQYEKAREQYEKARDQYGAAIKQYEIASQQFKSTMSQSDGLDNIHNNEPNDLSNKKGYSSALGASENIHENKPNDSSSAKGYSPILREVLMNGENEESLTDKYNINDPFKVIKFLEMQDPSFTKHPKSYWNDELENILLESSDQLFGTSAAQLKDDVAILKQDFSSLYSYITEWGGSSNNAANEAVECILGKYACTLGNIDNALEPTCEAFDRLKENLKRLKEMNETLNGGVEEGSDPAPGSLEGVLKKLNDELGKEGEKSEDTLYGQLKKLQEELDELKTKQEEAQKAVDAIKAERCPDFSYKVDEHDDSNNSNNSNKVTDSHTEVDQAKVDAWESDHASRLAEAQKALDAVNQAITDKETEIDKKNEEIERKKSEIEKQKRIIDERKTKMDQILKEIAKDYEMIKSLNQNITSFKQYMVHQPINEPLNPSLENSVNL